MVLSTSIFDGKCFWFFTERFTAPFTFPPLTEFESEQAHPTAKVLRALLRPGGRQEHPHRGHEQPAAERRAHAPQVRPEGLHLQAEGVGKGAGQGRAHIQRPGFHAGQAGGGSDGGRQVQRGLQDHPQGLSGKVVTESHRCSGTLFHLDPLGIFSLLP